ncbi:MAG: flagellar biosynthesis protein FlhB [Candidatus Hydrogenedentes bacterium]|nr:flagellar biosynthesis protein FlhB [Candidatus Hydrogenedentota bacterium]
MPEDVGGEKVFPPTPRKKERAREEGNVARSQDLTSAVGLFAGLIALWFLAPFTLAHFSNIMTHYLGGRWFIPINSENLQMFFTEIAIYILLGALPYILIMMAGGLAIAFAQVGFLWTGKPLMPKLNRINPISGFQRYFSLRTYYELGKNIAKLSILLIVVYYALRNRWEEIVTLPNYSVFDILYLTGNLFVALWWRVALVMLVLGVADYGFQWWQREQDLRMTVKEMQEELKELEGDPAIKRRIRQMQKRIAYQRMLREVPKADVVITNPTKLAVAIRYDMKTMPAPIVLAKGARIIAEKIREIAIQHQVPILQKPELAQILYRTVNVGEPIPEKLFRAVAEVLAFIYQIDRRAEKIKEREEIMNTLLAKS